MPKPVYPKKKGKSHPTDCELHLKKHEDHYDFIFADAPSNDVYRIDPIEHSKFTGRWMGACCRALKKNGVLCLNGSVDLVRNMNNFPRLHGFKRIAWLVWPHHEAQTLWGQANTHCLVWCRTLDFTWNKPSPPFGWSVSISKNVRILTDAYSYSDDKTYLPFGIGRR